MEETLHPGFGQRLEVDKVLFDSETDHQRLVLFENGPFGRVLTLDKVVQTTERDEFIYHEMLSHLPILAHGAVRRVLIVGGGDGGMAEEVLKHPAIEAVTQVEIDLSVVEFAKTHLRAICGEAYEDPRHELVIDDGLAFVERVGANPEGARFDLLIVDSTDPIGPGEALFTDRFYRACKAVLAPGGVLVTQNGVPFLQGEELTDTLASLRGLFADATCYLATVPTYSGGPMAFGWASDDASLRRHALAELEDRYRTAGLELGYLNAPVHQAAFALPNYVKALIEA